MNHILFAIPYNAPRERREVAREMVAERFDGIAATTQLVGERDFGRLYRMERRLKGDNGKPSMREPVEVNPARRLAAWMLLGSLMNRPLDGDAA